MAKKLPEDLVTEILLWLPVASLLRCKCVCKSWYALITHQKFITKHILHNKKNSNTLILVKMRDTITKNDVVSTLSHETLQVLHSQPLPPPFLVLGSCNGLVCLHAEHAYNTLKVVLWNPATKETKVVPKSNLPHFVPAGHKFGIDGIGFGFDAKTNDYKIINLLIINDPHSRGKMAQSEVYSLSADSWRKVDAPPFSISPVFSISARGMITYTNGIASLTPYGDDWGNLLSFDMSNEVFLKTPLPDGVLLDEFSDWTEIFALNESIAMVVLVWDKGMSEICYDIWLLLEVGVKDSWTKLFSIGPFTDFKQPRPLGFWKNDAVLFENLDGQMVLYDPSTKEMTNLPIHGQIYSLQLVTYMETLVSVNGRK